MTRSGAGNDGIVPPHSAKDRSDVDDLHRFGDDQLSVAVSAQGAELHSLRDAAGREWLWQEGPLWPRRAPVLFPIVGRLADDTLRHEGRTFRLTQHGFARDRRFSWVTRSEAGCQLRLRDDESTRAVFPFSFVLDLSYAVARGALSCDVGLSNPGKAALVFSVGAHPAFAWPLPGGGNKDAHSVVFGADEPGPARRLTDGLLDGAEELRLRGRRLPLNEDLFAADALVLPQVRSRSLRYEGPAGDALEMSWSGYGDLGLWSKAGADFLCLEPWCGHASPAGWDGEFADKPGTVRLMPGEGRTFRWEARTAAAPSGQQPP